jgi:hypothetical protein
MDVFSWHFAELGKSVTVRFAPTTAIKQECFYLTDALLLTDQSKLTDCNPWQGQGNLIVMQP